MTEFDRKADMEMWQNAIKEARQQLRTAEGRVMRLKAAIRVFEQNIKNGEPWPRSDTSPEQLRREGT